MDNIKVGDSVFKILSFENKLYVQVKTIQKVTPKGRIICGFNPSQGLKIAAINQFNGTYFAWWRRGKELNEFQCFSLQEELDRNIYLFRKRFQRVTGSELPKGNLYIY